MQSLTVEPDRGLDAASDVTIPDALREAVEEELEFLDRRHVKLIRMRCREDSDEVFQVTIYAGDEMYRLGEVGDGHVSRTVFRNPESFEIPDEDEEAEAAAAEEEYEEDVPEEIAESVFQVELVKEGATIEVHGDEYILDVAEEEGFDLPYSCREGACVSCSARVEGDVDQPRADAIDQSEMDEGYALTCIAMPRSDMKVYTNEKP
jgi:2Fe-2S type ferredoxin